jgi:hypothetical protein
MQSLKAFESSSARGDCSPLMAVVGSRLAAATRERRCVPDRRRQRRERRHTLRECFGSLRSDCIISTVSKFTARKGFGESERKSVVDGAALLLRGASSLARRVVAVSVHVAADVRGPTESTKPVSLRRLCGAKPPRERPTCSPPLGIRRMADRLATWLILPVVICLSQRLSHACLSTNLYTVKLRMAH